MVSHLSRKYKNSKNNIVDELFFHSIKIENGFYKYFCFLCENMLP